MCTPTALTVLRRVYPQLIPQRLISWLTLRRFIDKVIRNQLVKANHSVTILFRSFLNPSRLLDMVNGAVSTPS